ncbi:MAG: ABC transporter ATP-binding protein [Ignavibacteria bacterium]
MLHKNLPYKSVTYNKDVHIFKRLLSFIKPYKWKVALAVLLTLSISALSAVRPKLTQVAIDDKILYKDFVGLQLIAIILLLTLILQGFIQYASAYLTSYIGQKVTFDLRKKVYSHIVNLNVRFFDKTPIGKLVTRVTNDIDVLFEVFSSGLVTAFGDIFTLFWIMYFMFSISYELSFITLTVLPLLIYATAVFRKKVRASYTRIRSLVAKMNTYIQEHISGIQIVQLFLRENYTIKEFEVINREHTEENKRSIFYYAVFFPVVELIGAIAIGLIIWYGGGKVVQNELSLGVIISFLQYTEMFFRPIRDLSEKYNILQTAIASSDRIFELLDTKNEVVDSQTPKHITDFDFKIEFKDVWFAYEGNNYVLKNINFCIEKGERVAIVGATGSGKTSLINLLCRFYDVSKGAIFINGIDIRELPQKELRSLMSIVLQDVVLFSGTLKSNLTFGNDELPDEYINSAIESSGIEHLLKTLPEGIYKNVSEQGSSFSVGQRQLIALARALAFQRQILILDEATANIDTETEHIIQAAIQKLMMGRTAIIIAHRLSTIQNCDKIIVMHKGEIREIGTHTELLQKKGIYFKLYQLQFNSEQVIEK